MRQVALFFFLQTQLGLLLPAGTIVHARLTTAVSSQTARAGDPVAAAIVAPVTIGGREVPAGTLVRGRVAAVSPHTIDREAQLRLAFTQLELNGVVTPIDAHVAAVDNARESVSADGTILGPTTRADSNWGRLELLALAFLVPELFALDVGGSRLREGVRVDVSYPSGVDLDLRIVSPVTLTPGALRDTLPDVALAAPLVDAARAAPHRTAAGTPPRAADVINLLFVGSRTELQDAFARAGWSTADQLGMRADVLSVLAILAQEGYRQAPVSVETLEGRTPDAVFQKQTNTFAKRHHVRIWRHVSLEGQALWLGAATHDVGVKFDTANRSFTHRIDRTIDLERDKIVNDLAYAGLPRAAYVDRPSMPQSMENAERDPMDTDGRIAVVRLTSSR